MPTKETHTISLLSACLLINLLKVIELNPLNPIRIVLADDHSMVRESLARVLDSSGEISVVGQVGNGQELINEVENKSPDCLVMDYSMPEHDPIETIKSLTQKRKQLKILVLTVHENVHYAVRTIQAGARGYLIKSAAVDELVDAIKTIMDGEVYLSRKISSQVWSQLWQSNDKPSGIQSLSAREFEVFQMIGSGETLQECAKRLDVSVSTVSTYRSRILEKLGLNTTSELIRFAIENGMAS